MSQEKCKEDHLVGPSALILPWGGRGEIIDAGGHRQKDWEKG